MDWDCNCPLLFSMVNTQLTTAHSFNTIDPFNNAGWQSLFVSYKVSGIPSALFCGSLSGSLNILCLDEGSLASELGNSSGGKEWFLSRISYWLKESLIWTGSLSSVLKSSSSTFEGLDRALSRSLVWSSFPCCAVGGLEIFWCCCATYFLFFWSLFMEQETHITSNKYFIRC